MSQAGVTIIQGHFSNHYREYCPNDPSSWWTWGTRIDMENSIPQHDRNGQIEHYSTFYLYDIGDLECTQGDYWVDIYFGRWETRSISDPDYCCCGGVVCPGVCNNGFLSSCNDAIEFGPNFFWYTGPIRLP
jgi:hypothetical protein